LAKQVAAPTDEMLQLKTDTQSTKRWFCMQKSAALTCFGARDVDASALRQRQKTYPAKRKNPFSARQFLLQPIHFVSIFMFKTARALRFWPTSGCAKQASALIRARFFLICQPCVLAVHIQNTRSASSPFKAALINCGRDEDFYLRVLIHCRFSPTFFISAFIFHFLVSLSTLRLFTFC
jgi:hypothetical protein